LNFFDFFFLHLIWFIQKNEELVALQQQIKQLQDTVAKQAAELETKPTEPPVTPTKTSPATTPTTLLSPRGNGSDVDPREADLRRREDEVAEQEEELERIQDTLRRQQEAVRCSATAR